MARPTLEHPMNTPLLIDDRFEVRLDQMLGEGGISQVFAGRDLATGRRIAAKRLRPKLADDEEARWRFEREQRISSVLEDPHVVRFVEATDTWLLLEYVDGTNLKKVLAERAPLPVDDAVRVLRGTAAGLAHLHQLGIVHLDVKPQNIMLTPTNRVKLIDLGLAHEFADQQLDQLGTVAYMAPEQIDRGPVDGRTDVYSLGCVFFELLTGQPPFTAPGLTGDEEQAFLLDAHRYDEAPPPSSLRDDLPIWVNDVVDRALSKAPEERYQSAGDLLVAVDRATGVHVERPHAQRVEIRPPARSPVDPSPEEPARSRVPGVIAAAGGWLLRMMSNLAKWLLRLPGRMSRRLAILAGILALVIVLNLPWVSNGLLEVAIDVVPWTQADVTADGLALRSDPTQQAPQLLTLDSDDTVVVTGLPQSGEGYTWWPVVVEGERGWVAGEFLEETGLMRAVTIPGDTRDAIGGLWGWILP